MLWYWCVAWFRKIEYSVWGGEEGVGGGWGGIVLLRFLYLISLSESSFQESLFEVLLTSYSYKVFIDSTTFRK